MDPIPRRREGADGQFPYLFGNSRPLNSDRLQKQGKSSPSFLTKMIEDGAAEKYKFNDLEIAWAAGNLLTAGGDVSKHAHLS